MLQNEIKKYLIQFESEYQLITNKIVFSEKYKKQKLSHK